jgi:rubrerythrin
MKMTIEIPEEYINYLGKRVMDEYQYRGFTIGEWADKIMNNAPTADVEPVKHGRWERRMRKIYTCSECNSEVTDRQRKNYSFCPYCGAIMDGGAENETN